MNPPPRVLTTAGAARLGWTEARVRTELRRGSWQRLTSGVLLTRPDEPTRADWINAGMHLGGPHAVLSGWDAIRLRGLGPANPASPHVLILAPSGHNRVVGSVRLRRSTRPLTYTETSPLDETLPSVRIAQAARAVADTSLVCSSLVTVRAFVTQAVQQGLCTSDELRRELEDGPRNGSRWLRRVLEDVDLGARSVSEAELASLMRAAGLPAFELNVPLLDEVGRHIATADVLWRSLRAVLEVDSKQHHFLEPQWRSTMRRHNALTRYAVAVTHYAPAEFRDRPARVMAEIGAWLAARAAELRMPYPPPPTERPRSPFRLG